MPNLVLAKADAVFDLFSLLKLRIFFANRILIIDDEEFCITALK